MNRAAAQRIAVLAPFHTLALDIPGLPVTDAAFPLGMGGYCIVTLVKERLKRGLPTDVITLDPMVTRPIMRWDGGLVRLWVVQRRARRALRDGYHHERQLLQQALRESNPMVCHANWTYEYGLAAVTQKDYPVVLTVHDHALHCLRWLGPKYLPLFLITQCVLHRAQHITTVSPYVAEYLERKLGRKVQVLPNLLPALAWQMGDDNFTRGVEDGRQKLEIRSQKSEARGQNIGKDLVTVAHGYTQIKAKEIQMISVINGSRLKNPRRALLAFQIARKRCRTQGISLQYTLLGPGLGAGEAAEHWAEEHGCSEGVLFKGEVPYQESIRMIGKAALLCHPSLEESFGSPVAEAMLLGVPVLAAREAGGTRWLLDEGRCGLLFDGSAVESIAAAMMAMAVQIPAGMMAAARRRIGQICDADAVLAGYESMYQQALAGWRETQARSR
jgi:glycosyltransferase involved in cell wall biosynthesis